MRLCVRACVCVCMLIFMLILWMLNRYEITANWVQQTKGGCSIDTPAACEVSERSITLTITPIHAYIHIFFFLSQLFSKVKKMGCMAIRGGYSALAPQTHLQPHFGLTNGQWKMHLGLIVPAGGYAFACIIRLCVILSISLMFFFVTHTLTHSLTHSFTHTHTLTYSLTYNFPKMRNIDCRCTI